MTSPKLEPSLSPSLPSRSRCSSRSSSLSPPPPLSPSRDHLLSKGDTSSSSSAIHITTSLSNSSSSSPSSPLLPSETASNHDRDQKDSTQILSNSTADSKRTESTSATNYEDLPIIPVFSPPPKTPPRPSTIHTHEHTHPIRSSPHEHPHEPPSKRRKVDDPDGLSIDTAHPEPPKTPTQKIIVNGDFSSTNGTKDGLSVTISSKKKRESPPWKKVAADVPTVLFENGRRKSGRISRLLQDPIPTETPPSDPPLTPSLSSTPAPNSRKVNTPSLEGLAATPDLSSSQKRSSRRLSSRTNIPPPPSTPTSSRESTNRKITITSTPSTSSIRVSPRSHRSKPTPAITVVSNPSSSSRKRAPSASLLSNGASQPPPNQRQRRSARISAAADELEILSTSAAGVPSSSALPSSSSRRVNGGSGRSRANLRSQPRDPTANWIHTRIPIVNPSQIPARAPTGLPFSEYWKQNYGRPVEEGGLFAPLEDGPEFTDETAAQEARIILQIEDEAEEGGRLSSSQCTLFAPDVAEEPPRQYAHWDHLVKAAANFRRLMLAEQQRHKATAKKIAEACRDEWIRRQPKSQEEVEAEARALSIVQYRVVLKSLVGTWENVHAEIQRRRLADWEIQEQKRVKAALNQAVNLSEQKLQARLSTTEDDPELEDFDQGLEDVDELSDENDEEEEEDPEEEEDDDDDDDDDMMSSDDEESGDEEVEEGEPVNGQDGTTREAIAAHKTVRHEDDGLSQEQLRAKYANLPEIITSVEVPRPSFSSAPSPTSSAVTEETHRTRSHTSLGGGVPEETSPVHGASEKDVDDGETTDESIDMDDDMGSSDMDSDEEDEEDEDDDDDDDDEEGGTGDEEEEVGNGLLGMLFDKSELRDLKKTGHPEEELKREESQDVSDENLVNGTASGTIGESVDSETLPNGADQHDKIDSASSSSDEDDVMMVDTSILDDEPDPVVVEKQPASEEMTEVVEETRDTAKPQVLRGDRKEDSMDGQENDGQWKNALENHDQQPDTQENMDLVEVGVGVIAEVDAEAESMQDTPDHPEANGVDSASSHPLPDTTVIATASETPAASNESTESPALTTNLPIPSTESKEKVDDDDDDDLMDVASESPSHTLKTTSATPTATTPNASTRKTEIPFLLRGTLREYQHDGLDWLAGLYANQTNGILADEMGLGKTIQTIALLAHLACHHGKWGPHLVIVPTSVMLNWEMEFKKWCPGFKILAYYGSQEERRRKRVGWNNDDLWNVCITSYQLVLQDQQVFRRRRWHYMILDEAHNIKNFKSQRWQTLLGFNTHSRLLLTGTPLQNNLTELWSLMFFLMPSNRNDGKAFVDLPEFNTWFRRPESQILENGKEEMDEEARAIIAKLHKVLRPYLLRRLKADVEKQMPAKYEHLEYCRLSKRQRELYDGFLARSDTRATLSSGNYLSIINCLMQLRKVCNHPDLFVDRPIMTSFRMERSVARGYVWQDWLVRKTCQRSPSSSSSSSLVETHPFQTVNLAFLNLVPTLYDASISTHASETIERLSRPTMDRIRKLRSTQQNRFQSLIQVIGDDVVKAGGASDQDPRECMGKHNGSVLGSLMHIDGIERKDRLDELDRDLYTNQFRRQQRPIYGKNVLELLDLGLHDTSLPNRPKPRVPQCVLDWFTDESRYLEAAVKTVDQRSEEMHLTIQKFACATPAVVARDLNRLVLESGVGFDRYHEHGQHLVHALQQENARLSRVPRWSPFIPEPPRRDPWHEARIRLSIQFPDQRLLQYDCGKLQVLDRLLRKLQAGGHRALIFTQMTKVLDILEQFLNIHGHKYLRLDGATKVEQRQLLTDRFNSDKRILCFILSTRSGGLGINLTGADTVIFYDQDWNPAMDKQCQDRCHRIGQTRDVHIYRLVSEHTIEANILRKASQKQMLDDVVIQEGEFTTGHMEQQRKQLREEQRKHLVEEQKLQQRQQLKKRAHRSYKVHEDDDSDDSDVDLEVQNAAASAAMDRVLGNVNVNVNSPTTAPDEDRPAALAASTASATRSPTTTTTAAASRAALSGTGTAIMGHSLVSQTRVMEQAEDQEDVAAARVAEREVVSDDVDFAVEAPRTTGSQVADVAAAETDATLLAADAAPVEYDATGRVMGTIDDYMLQWAMEMVKDTPLDIPRDRKRPKLKKKDRAR